MTESFFASLETELIDRTVFRTHRDPEQELFSYIEGFYNPWRRHSANGQLSPAEYERRHPPRTSAAVIYATAQNTNPSVPTRPKQLHARHVNLVRVLYEISDQRVSISVIYLRCIR